MKRMLGILAITLFFPFLVTNSLAGGITVTDSWIREAPPGAKATAAYMTISNASSQTVQLDSAASADFEMIEMHRTEMHDGMAHMKKQTGIRIEAGKSVQLKPGDFHLMLMRPRRSLKAGDQCGLQLRFDNGESIAVQAIVRKQ